MPWSSVWIWLKWQKLSSQSSGLIFSSIKERLNYEDSTESILYSFTFYFNFLLLNSYYGISCCRLHRQFLNPILKLCDLLNTLYFKFILTFTLSFVLRDIFPYLSHHYKSQLYKIISIYQKTSKKLFLYFLSLNPKYYYKRSMSSNIFSDKKSEQLRISFGFEKRLK